MATYSNDALRVPSSALRARGILPELTAAEQAAYLEARAARSREGRFAEILGKAGTTTDVLPGDEIPENWLDGRDASEDPSGSVPHTGR
jgi:hypothetical protein